MSTVRKLCDEQEISDAIRFVKPWEDDFIDADGQDDLPSDEEPRPLDLDEDSPEWAGFERGYN